MTERKREGERKRDPSPNPTQKRSTLFAKSRVLGLGISGFSRFEADHAVRQTSTEGTRKLRLGLGLGRGV